MSDDETDLPDLPRKTISDGSTPWNNIKEIVIGQRYSSVLSSLPDCEGINPDIFFLDWQI